MLRTCSKCKGKMIKINKSLVVNLANPASKIPESSEWWICQNENCKNEEKA